MHQILQNNNDIYIFSNTANNGNNYIQGFLSGSAISICQDKTFTSLFAVVFPTNQGIDVQQTLNQIVSAIADDEVNMNFISQLGVIPVFIGCPRRENGKISVSTRFENTINDLMTNSKLTRNSITTSGKTYNYIKYSLDDGSNSAQRIANS